MQVTERLYLVMGTKGNTPRAFVELLNRTEPGAHPDEIDHFVTHRDASIALGLGDQGTYGKVEEALTAAGVEYGVIENTKDVSLNVSPTRYGRLGGNGTCSGSSGRPPTPRQHAT